MASYDYQYIIVGSGVAGATIAKRLLERNAQTPILMLEAGPKIDSRNRRFWWDQIVLNGQTRRGYGPLGRRPYDFTYDQGADSRSVGGTDYFIPSSRVIAYGGSTLHWGGWSLRMKPEDFFLKTNTGMGADWPFDYNHLENWYEEAEDYLAVCGDDSESWNKSRKNKYPFPPYRWTAADGEMIEAFQRHGIEPGKMPLARYRRCMTTGTCKYCPIGARYSADSVLDELRAGKAEGRFPKFDFFWNAPSTRIVTDSAKRNRITGVEYCDLADGELNTAQVDKKGSVIVCSGAYESPKLLMASRNRQWRNGIGNDHDLVGRFVVTHSILSVRGRLNRNPERWFQEYDFPTLMSRSWDTEQTQPHNKVFLFKNRKLPHVDLAGLMIAGKTRNEIDEQLTGSRLTELQAFMEEKGRFENRLTLARGHTRFGLPRMRVDFTRPKQTTDNGNVWLEKMKQVVLDMGYEVVDKKIGDPGGHHTTGTCRMATSPEEGVTDENLRVHGTDNLYVCSNAVFPSGSAINPTLTLTALALRLTEHL